MRLSDMLAGRPPVRYVVGARLEIRKNLESACSRLVVVDDDPTGTQTVHGVKVYTTWSTERLHGALISKHAVFYISTNSRSLNAEEATNLGLDLGKNLSEAAQSAGVDVILASRSDSTLRGHFPYEVDALASGLGQEIDGIIIAPAFFEGGRYTIDDIHWVDQSGELVSAEQTEFARDPVFGYRHGNLKLWVEEKTAGAIKAKSVRSVSLETVRQGGPNAVAEELMKASKGCPIIVNAACYDDLDTFVLGLIAAESEGKRFVYRCAASLVKARGGFDDKPLLTREEMNPADGAGLVIVGSYVGRTSRQIESLLKAKLASGTELRVDLLLDVGTRDSEIQRVSDWANEQLRRGCTAAVFTSRTIHPADRKGFLNIGDAIMAGLCEVVHRVEERPGFVVAKGGITSIELARSALYVEEADVLGQVIAGVPVWRLGDGTRWPGIPYIVFPGNVGNDDALSNTVRILQGRDTKLQPISQADDS